MSTMFANLPIDLGFHPGVIILARISNNVENPEHRGKYRPVIVVAAPDNLGIRPVVAGLTTSPEYWDGTPRIRLEPRGMADAVAYLWSGHLIRLADGTYKTRALGLLTVADAEAVLAEILPGDLQPARRVRFLESVAELNERYSRLCR